MLFWHWLYGSRLMFLESSALNCSPWQWSLAWHSAPGRQPGHTQATAAPCMAAAYCCTTNCGGRHPSPACSDASDAHWAARLLADFKHLHGLIHWRAACQAPCLGLTAGSAYGAQPTRVLALPQSASRRSGSPAWADAIGWGPSPPPSQQLGSTQLHPRTTDTHPQASVHKVMPAGDPLQILSQTGASQLSTLPPQPAQACPPAST